MRGSTAVRVSARSSLERAGLERIAASAGLVVAGTDAGAPIGLRSGEVPAEGPRNGAVEQAVATVIVNADEVVVRLRQPVEPGALDDVIALVRAASAPA